MELAVAVAAGGLVAELGMTGLDSTLVTELGVRMRGIGILGYGVMLLTDGDGSAEPGWELLDYGLEDEFEAAASELGLPIWGEGSRSVAIGSAEPEEPQPWTSVRIVLRAEGPAESKRLDIGRVVWLADRLGGDALISYGVWLHAHRDLRLDQYILDDAWCEELSSAFDMAVAELGILPWPIDHIRIQPAHEEPVGWAEERRYRPWPPVSRRFADPSCG